MLLRDYFAAHALQGILAGGIAFTTVDGQRLSRAEYAYSLADDMLEVRKGG